MLDKNIVDETYRVWYANRVTGASMSMLLYSDVDAHLMKTFDKVMEQAINSGKLVDIFKK